MHGIVFCIPEDQWTTQRPENMKKDPYSHVSE